MNKKIGFVALVATTILVALGAKCLTDGEKQPPVNLAAIAPSMSEVTKPAPTQPVTLKFEGTVTGLSGSGLILGLNEAQDLPVMANGPFTFPVSVEEGSAYTVTVKKQPSNPEQTCEVINGTGTFTDNKTEVTVVCSPWTKQLGAPEERTRGSGIAVDHEGNTYLAGYTFESESEVLFIEKYSPVGTKLYRKQIKGAFGIVTELEGGIPEYYLSLAIDNKGNVYLAGSTEGEFDENVPSGDLDGFMFLVKLDPAGNKLFSQLVNVTYGVKRPMAIAVDEKGRVFVAGTSTDFKTDIVTGFMYQFDAAGNEVKSRILGEELGRVAVATIDAQGDVFLAGPSNEYREDEGYYEFVSRVNRLDNLMYTNVNNYTDISALAADAQENLYVAWSDNRDLHGNELPGGEDIFLMKLDTIGHAIYIKQMGLSQGDDMRVLSLTTDVQGNVYLAGCIAFEQAGAVAKDGADLDNDYIDGNESLFLIKADPQGKVVYTKTRKENTVATAVATDQDGNVFISGITAGSLDGNSRKGIMDAFFSKYDSNGNLE